MHPKVYTFCPRDTYPCAKRSIPFFKGFYCKKRTSNTIKYHITSFLLMFQAIGTKIIYIRMRKKTNKANLC